MRKRMVSTGFAIASGLLLALNGAPVAAQTELAMAARVGGPIEKAVELEPESSAADAFRALARNCLTQLGGNEAAVRVGHAEGIHQMRVADAALLLSLGRLPQ